MLKCETDKEHVSGSTIAELEKCVTVEQLRNFVLLNPSAPTEIRQKVNDRFARLTSQVETVKVKNESVVTDAASRVLPVLDSAVVENVLNDVPCVSREFDSPDSSPHVDYLALLDNGCASASNEPARENVSIGLDEILRWIVEFDSVPDFISGNADTGQRGEGAVQGEVSPRAGDETLNPEAADKFGSFEVIDRRIRKFRTDFVEILLKVNQMPAEADPVQWVNSVFSEIVRLIQNSCQNHDLVGVEISSPNDEMRPIFITVRRADQLSADVIANVIDRVIQSGKNMFLEGAVTVHFLRCEMPLGGALRSFSGHRFEDFCKKKAAIVTTKSGEGGRTDFLCLPRAIVVGIALAERFPDYKAIRQDKNGIQSLMAVQLCLDAGVDADEIARNGGAGLAEVQKFQDFLTEYTLTVFEYGELMKAPVFKGPPSEPGAERKPIHLLLFKNHFNTVKSLTALFSVKYYCSKCNVGSHNPGEHFCPETCGRCHSTGCVTTPGFSRKCKDCNNIFQSQKCFDDHRTVPRYTRNRTVCQVRKICSCGQYVNLSSRKSAHKCGEKFCTLCKTFVEKDHACYIMRDNPPKHEKAPWAFVFFDLECRADTAYQGDDSRKVHTPNLCVSQTVCKACISVEENTHSCLACGAREHIFEGDDCVDRFHAYLSENFGKFKEVVVLRTMPERMTRFL